MAVLTDITIPREAIEAHAKALLTHETWGQRSWNDLSNAEREERIEGSETACLAMLRNWPGMYIRDYLTEPLETSIILPLTENPNDKG